ncbi:hypothetical protein BGX30_010543 [Mortierella sp. GBA39]|nr:hypothetical protein BGX30_010543 [Mortierella sp. GBA39]
MPEDRLLPKRRPKGQSIVNKASKLLRSALDHVEEIDDEDEARILREPMDSLQVHVKKALQIVSSPADSKTSKVSGTPSSLSSTSTTTTDTHAKSLPIPTGFAARSAAGATMPSGTPPGLSGSLNRHPLGLFSTSPNFGAQSPFASPKRLSASRFPSTPITAPSDSEAEAEAKAAPPSPPAPTRNNKRIINDQSRRWTVIDRYYACTNGAYEVNSQTQPSGYRSEFCDNVVVSVVFCIVFDINLVTPGYAHLPTDKCAQQTVLDSEQPSTEH